MDHFKKLIVWGMLATFPAAVYSLQEWRKEKKEPLSDQLSLKTAETKELEEVIEARLKKLAEIDIKILSAQGEILKYQEQKKELIRDLKKLEERIKPHLNQARR